MRTTSGHVRRCTPGSCVISSSKPVTERPADRKEPRTPTISKAIATRNDAGSSRPKRPIPVLWQAGTQGGRRRARAPQRRSDNRGCAAGLSPHALLFATRSSVRDSRLARSKARRYPSVAPCSGWSRPSRLRRWAAASLDHPLRAAPSKMAGRDGETARLCRTKKLLVDHISGLRPVDPGSFVLDVFKLQEE